MVILLMRVAGAIVLFGLTASTVHAEVLEDAVVRTSVLQMLSEGGWSMVPLLLCSMVALFLVLYTWWETTTRRMAPKDLVERCKTLGTELEPHAVMIFLGNHPSLLARCLQRAITTIVEEEPVTLFLQAAEREGKRLGQWVSYLNVVAAIAPMIGLLGTVSGMIGAFQTISSGGMGRPDMLASNIGEALVTTATGLSIAIPTMVLFFVIRNRLENKMEDLVEIGEELLPALLTHGHRSLDQG